MSGDPRRIDRRVVVFVGVMVALVVGYGFALGFAEAGALAGAPPGSTFNDRGDGAQVLLSYLGGLGVDVETLRQFEELPGGGTIVLIAAEPLELEATRVEGRRLRSWAEAGGRVVLVGPYARDVFYGTSIGIDEGPVGREGRMSPVQASAYAQDVEDVSVGAERLLASDTVWIAHLKDSSGSALASRAIGDGEIVWLASARPATNEGIGEADNARLVTLLAAQSGPVYFDEYHHGYAQGQGLWRRLGAGGRAAALLGVIAVTIAIAASARRLGPAIPVPDARPARTGAYIAQLAALYRKAGAYEEALTSLADGLKAALARRYGTIEAGRARNEEARDALERVQAVIERDRIEEETFVETARALTRARRDVEGRDG
jgi:hypothetical protein